MSFGAKRRSWISQPKCGRMTRSPGAVPRMMMIDSRTNSSYADMATPPLRLRSTGKRQPFPRKLWATLPPYSIWSRKAPSMYLRQPSHSRRVLRSDLVSLSAPVLQKGHLKLETRPAMTRSRTSCQRIMSSSLNRSSRRLGPKRDAQHTRTVRGQSMPEIVARADRADPLSRRASARRASLKPLAHRAFADYFFFGSGGGVVVSTLPPASPLSLLALPVALEVRLPAFDCDDASALAPPLSPVAEALLPSPTSALALCLPCPACASPLAVAL